MKNLQRYGLNLLIAAFLLVVMNSCKKKEDEFKLPTDVSMDIDINKSASKSGRLVFTGGYIIIQDFAIEGARVQADDVSMNKQFPGGFQVNFDGVGYVSQLDFDIPQGTYSELEIAFNTVSGAGNNLVTYGYFVDASNDTIPVQFEFASSEYFSVESEDDFGSTQIILNTNTAASGLIELDPVYWFDVISISSLESATQVNIMGVPTILITDSVNDNIFDLVADRVDESMESVIK